jgi:hypothetical protein
MKKKNIIIIGVLALGSYLFWRYSSNKKNFSGFPKSTYKEEPIQNNLAKFGLPNFGKPVYIEKK